MKNKLVIIGLVIFGLVINGFSATYYMDSSKTGISNNTGTSPANAFTNWVTLGATDGSWTHVLHGGDTLLIYPGVGYIGNRTGVPDAIVMYGILGVTNNPIVFKVIQTNGLVITPPFVVSGSFFTFDGRKSDTYTNLVNFDNMANIYQITNNINWWMHGIYGFGSNHQNGIYAPNVGAQMKFTWLHVDPYTFNTNNYPFGGSESGVGANTHGIDLLQNTGETLDGGEIGYCYIEEADQCAVFMVNNNAPKWRQFRIHHNVMTKMGDAGARLAGGFEVDHNIIGQAWMIHGHPNGTVQAPIDSLFHHNIVKNTLDTMMYTPGGGSPIATGIKIYNNLFYTTKDWSFIYTNEWSANSPFVNHSVGGIQFLVEANANNTEPWLPQVWTNFVFAGNTIIAGLGAVSTNANAGINGIISLPNRYAPGNTLSFEPGLDRGFIVITNMLSVNNLLYNVSPAGSGQTIGGFGGWVDRFNGNTNTWTNNISTYTAGILFDWANTNGGNHGSTNLLFDYNVVAADQVASKVFAYNGPFSTNCTFTSAEAFNTAYTTNGYIHNSSSLPSLVDTNNYDFRPRVNDTALISKGTNLYYWSFTPGGLPQYDIDLFGKTRPSIPSIGAFEPSYDMILHYTFDFLSMTNQIAFGLGGTGDDSGLAIATDSSNNTIVAGYFSGTINFGNGSLTSAGGKDIFVAKFSPSGSNIWAKGFGAAQDDQANGVTVDSTGNIYVVGQFTGTVDFGNGPLTSAGGTSAANVFVIKLDSSGNTTWSKRTGGTANAIANAVAIGPDNNIVIVGSFQGTNDFGGGNVMSTFSGIGSLTTQDTFVWKLKGSDGSYLWQHQPANNSQNRAYGVVVDGNTNVLFTGSFESSIDFIGGFSTFMTSAGAFDVFAVKYSGVDGSQIWEKRFGSTDSEEGLSITTDSTGDAIISGYFRLTVNFGNGALVSAGGDDIFLMRLDGSSGSTTWSKRFGSFDGDKGQGVTVDSFGNIVMTGFFSDVVNFGGTNLVSGGTVGGQFGSFDIFVAKFSSIGVHVSSEGYGGLLNNIGQGVAVDSSGVIVGTGSFKGSATFRDVSLTSAGLQDIYFFRLIDSVGIALGLNPVEHDITGYNSDMLYWGFTSTPTNWPTRILYTNNIGGFNYAAQFVNYTNHIPAYNNFTINQFGGITNISAFSNLTAITVCVWAKHADDVGETRNNVATFIDTCEGSPGPGVTWSLGRNSAYQTSFDIFTNQDYNTCCTMHLNFPDNDSTDWHFYVGTFSTTNQMMNIYLDGTNCDNRNFTGYCPWATNIMVGVPSSSGSYPGKNGWISIGCRTHVGSPQLDDGDQFPNNGWMDGQLADLRVYNRELSAGEVLAIYHGGGGTSIPVVVPPNTNGSPLIKATNLQIRNNGRIVIGH